MKEITEEINIKIVVVTEILGVGGISTHVQKIYKLMALYKDVEIYIITFANRNNLIENKMLGYPKNIKIRIIDKKKVNI